MKMTRFFPERFPFYFARCVKFFSRRRLIMQMSIIYFTDGSQAAENAQKPEIIFMRRY